MTILTRLILQNTKLFDSFETSQRITVLNTSCLNEKGTVDL